VTSTAPVPLLSFGGTSFDPFKLAFMWTIAAMAGAAKASAAVNVMAARSGRRMDAVMNVSPLAGLG
jgi:hypothetical protein